MGCDDSSLAGFRENESLNGFEGWGLFRFEVGKRVGFVEEIVLRDESHEGWREAIAIAVVSQPLYMRL